MSRFPVLVSSKRKNKAAAASDMEHKANKDATKYVSDSNIH